MTSRLKPQRILSWLASASLLTMSAFAGADTIKSEVELTSRDIGARETTLADVVADAIKASAKADAAFIAAISFVDAVDISRGSVKSDDIANSLVNKGETIVIVKLTGEQIERAIEQSLYLYPKSNSAFLQVSGLVVTLKPDAEAGKRVSTVKIDGESIDVKRTYRVAMPAPLANGALAYFKIWQKASVDRDTNTTIESALNSYFSDHKTIAKGDERLVNKR